MRVGSQVTLGSQWAQQAGGFAWKQARQTLGRPRGDTCSWAIWLLVLSVAFGIPTASGLKPVSAQTAPNRGAGQRAPQPVERTWPQGVIRITVNLVQVDAVVTDSKGRHVTNLQPADFEILEDGRPQTITNFSYIFTAKPLGIEAQAATPPAVPGVPAVPPVRLQPEQVRRSIVILVDDLNTAFADMVYVRQALNKFIDHDVNPGDLVAVLHTSGGLGVRQQFTNDKRVLHADVNALRYYLPGGVGLDFDSVSWVPTGSDRFAHRDKNELEAVRKDFEAAGGHESQMAASSGTMDALEYVLGGLRDLPGRKAVFLVSDGIPFPSEQRLRELADLANRSAAVVYTVGAQGLPTLSVDASVGPPPANVNFQGWLENMQDTMRAAYVDSRWPMEYLAQQTEGLCLHDNNDLAGGMHEMMDDLSGYYLIGYKPPAATFKEDKAGRGYHRIQVKVKVKGLRVRTRPGFYGIPDSATPPVYSRREEQLRAAAVSPFSTAEVRVQLAPQFLNRGKKDSLARLWMHIDARDLTFQDAPGGNKQGEADLMAVAFGDNGVIASGVEGPIKGSFQPAEFEAMRRRGVNYRLDLPIKKPGGYQVRVAVRDPASQKLGSASQFIEIPNLHPDRLALSGIVLNANALGESGPAVRRVKAGARVSYELEVYNARRESTTQALDLENKIEIFRDGRLLWAQNPVAISQVPRNSNRLKLSGEFVLALDVAPGDYVLLVTVIDKLAPPRNSAARRWISFQVAP